MLIVDAQVHIWSSGKPTNATHRQVPAFTKDDLLRRWTRPASTRPCSIRRRRGIRTPTSSPSRRRASTPNRFAILGNFPLIAREPRADRRWKARPGMLGLRFTFLQPHQKTWPTDGTHRLAVARRRARRHSRRAARGGFLPKVGEVAERHPQLKLIIDHLGRPSGTKDDAAWANLPEMLALAKHPNVAIKATGAPSYSSEAYPYRNIHGTSAADLRRLRPRAHVLGHRHHAHAVPWRQCVTMFTEEMPWLSAARPGAGHGSRGL